MTKLRVGPDLALPNDAVTQTFVIFGKRGSGKSNTGVVLAEEMHRAGGQIVVLDPVGAWWGLKSSFDGAGPGLPVYIFGGTHGDLPLQPTAGQLMAQVAIAHRIPMVLDMSGWAGAERARFVTAFATWLLAHNDRTPVHVFLEEADAFIPQRPYKGEEAMLGAMDRLIRWGRQEGIGATAITQRSAKINKDVTTQAEVLIAHRTIGPQDVAAIKEWIKYHSTGDEQQEILASLPTLPDGTAWVWSPDWLDLLRTVPFRRRETFDSASTPKLGEKRIQPKALAPVDVDALRDQLAATVEQAKANDPAELRRRIAALERQLADRPTAAPERIVETIVEIPILTTEDRAVLVRVEKAQGDLQRLALDIMGTASGIRYRLDERIDGKPTQEEVRRHYAASGLGPLAGKLPPPKPETVAALSPTPARSPRPNDVTGGQADERPLSGYGRRLLDTLAQRHPMRLTRAQLGILSGSSRKSSSFDAAAAEIRKRGFADLTEAGFAMTAAGWDEIGEAPSAPRSPDELRATWLRALPKAEAALLGQLIEAYPNALTRAEIAEAAGYSLTSSTFQAAIPSLRKAGLVDDARGVLTAAEVLFS